VPNTPFITKTIADQGAIRPGTTSTSTVAPLYLYTEKSKQQNLIESLQRTPNLNLLKIEEISLKLKLKFTNEKEDANNTFAPIDVLDYVYAVLNSQAYRDKYKEFLISDFPRVPYPTNATIFWQLVKFGGELRLVHLFESDTLSKYITKYPIDGDNIITKIKYDSNKVYINDTQYFDGVPTNIWELSIGGYQPAQRWLKDRKERELNFNEISHYQKIIVVLIETERLIKEIDEVIEI
jgi:predicted helicase